MKKIKPKNEGKDKKLPPPHVRQGPLSLEEPFGLQVFVVEEGIEAGTLLEPFVGRDMSVAVAVWRQIAVTEDDGVGELVVELREQGAQALALCLGTRVGRFAVGIQTTLVTYAYRMLVVALAVGPVLAQRTPRVDGAVARNIIMVPDILHTTADMVLAAALEAIALPGPGGRAMKDDECDRSHNCQLSNATGCGDRREDGCDNGDDDLTNSLQCFLCCLFHNRRPTPGPSDSPPTPLFQRGEEWRGE